MVPGIWVMGVLMTSSHYDITLLGSHLQGPPGALGHKGYTELRSGLEGGNTDRRGLTRASYPVVWHFLDSNVLCRKTAFHLGLLEHSVLVNLLGQDAFTCVFKDKIPFSVASLKEVNAQRRANPHQLHSFLSRHGFM